MLPLFATLEIAKQEGLWAQGFSLESQAPNILASYFDGYHRFR